MTAPYKYKSEPWSKICVQEDWSIAALDFLGGRRGITGEFQYSTLGIHILTGIIAAVSKMTTVDFANKFLLEPLSIAPRKIYVAPDAETHKAFTIGKTPKGKIWFSDNKGVGAAGYGLCLSADEMAKIGLLCLKNGIFNNKRIVSEKWLEESFMVRLCCGEKFRDMKYGYLWWIIDENEGSYAAIGNSGNVIYINHRKDLVVAVSSYFKPTIFDRIDFIKEQIEEKFETERKVKTVK